MDLETFLADPEPEGARPPLSTFNHAADCRNPEQVDWQFDPTGWWERRCVCGTVERWAPDPGRPPQPDDSAFRAEHRGCAAVVRTEYVTDGYWRSTCPGCQTTRSYIAEARSHFEAVTRRPLDLEGDGTTSRHGFALKDLAR